MTKDQRKELLRLERLADLAFHRQASHKLAVDRAKETYDKAQKLYNETLNDVYITKSELIQARISFDYYK